METENQAIAGSAPMLRDPRSGRLSRIALVVAVFSLLLNLVLIAQLRRPERWLLPAATRLLAGVGGEDASFQYDVRIPAGTPIRADIPVDETFQVAVDTVIPLNTTVRVPFRSPFGTHSVDLPIRADVPIRARLPIRIQHTFQLDTSTAQEIVVPIQIRLGDLEWDQAAPGSH